MSWTAPFAIACSGAGLVCALIAASRGRPRVGIAMMLDLWVAAGLLNLAGTTSWPALGGAAAMILVRHLVTGSERLARRLLSSRP